MINYNLDHAEINQTNYHKLTVFLSCKKWAHGVPYYYNTMACG